jgi:chaperonin GroEL
LAPKQVIYSDDSRQAMLRGVNQLADAVKVTFGPKGLNVLLAKETGTPTFTKDGVTVAKEIVLSDPFENMGAQMAREAASKTSEIAGDGTTTATILAQSIFREGVKCMAAGANPMAVKRGIERAVAAVLEELARISKSVSGPMIDRIGTISANGDAMIGRLIGDAARKVGKDGVITVEQSQGLETLLEIVEGMQFDRGYINSHFVTDVGRMEAVIENPYILVYDKKISSLHDLVPLLEATTAKGSSLLIIADDVEGEALAGLVVNTLRGNLRACAIKAPGFGDHRKAMLQDIAVLTGGRAITEELGTRLASVRLEELGRAKRVVVGQDSTTLIGGNGRASEIESRIRNIRTEINKTSSDRDRGQLEDRIAKLLGSVAVIKVGAATETEMLETKARVENAVHATRAAIEGGIVPGGGVALLRCSSVLDVLKLQGDEHIGVGIIRRTCQEPLRQLARNAGYSGPTVVGRVLASDEQGYGFNAVTGKFEDLLISGIIDPTKVTRSALQNAASVSAVMLTAEAAISEIPEGSKAGKRATSYAKTFGPSPDSRRYDELSPTLPTPIATSHEKLGDWHPEAAPFLATERTSEGKADGPKSGPVSRSGKRPGFEGPRGGGKPPMGPGPPGAGAPPGGDEPPNPPVFPLIDAKPEHVVQCDMFSVTVSLKSTESPNTRGEVQLPPGKQHTLDVHVLLGNNSSWDTLVWTRARGTTKKAKFHLVAPWIPADENQNIPDRLYATVVVNFYLQGRWCGEGLRSIELLLNKTIAPSARIPPPTTPTWSKLLNLEPGAEPPDLLVRIQKTLGAEYEWNLVSPHLDLRPSPGVMPDRKELSDGAHRFVRSNFDRVSGSALDDKTIPVIEQRCREIYDSTTESFKDAYWKLLAAEKSRPSRKGGKGEGGVRPRIKSIQFISDEPNVPWELMLIRENDVTRNPEGVKEEILSIRHAVGRWTAKVSGLLLQKIEIQEMAVFASDYTEVEGVVPKLPWAVEEREWLVGQYGASRGTLKFEPVTHFFKEGKAQAVHFSCHGDMNVELPEKSALWLEDYPQFVTAYIAGEDVRAGEGSQHPLVFLNACQLAGAGPQLSLITGWPQSFLEAGASACIAPLWSVLDKSAGEASAMFYRLVFDEHKTLGEALQHIRKEWRTRRSLTFLSYVLYGDPMAQVLWRRPTPEAPAVL